MSRYVIGITGASGSIYGIRLIEELLSRNCEVLLTITDAGRQVIQHEVGWELGSDPTTIELNFKKHLKVKTATDRLHYFDVHNVGASIASGSVLTNGMIIVPCTMSAVSAIANGSSSDLLERAADVILKEGRQLIIVPREAPLSQIHLRNLLTLSQMGVHIVPPVTAFYFKPQSIEELVNYIVGRILDLLGIEHKLLHRWQG
ncbi:MAG TPA: UbiX family flavin prenyltransferase [Clostridia bacterium]|jgi:4-hydroxy-3-polyprenylbenzoate decarboxylase|nr:UbiX family flavin prenyltransferase [Clostridia bacterium]